MRDSKDGAMLGPERRRGGKKKRKKRGLLHYAQTTANYFTSLCSSRFKANNIIINILDTITVQ